MVPPLAASFTTKVLRNKSELPVEWFAYPSSTLKPYIWGYRGLIIPERLQKSFVQITAPTARSMLYIVFGAPSTTEILLPGTVKGEHFKRPNHALILPTQQRWGVDISAASDAVCVIFHPGMLSLFLNESLYEFESTWIDPADFWMQEVSNQLADIEAQSLKSRVTMLESILISQLEKSRFQYDSMIDQAIFSISDRKGVVSMETLAASLGMSLRQLRRKFQFHVGMSPKQFARIERFRHASEFASQHYPKISLAETALQFGYFDQAHFTRDVLAITGQPPKAFALSNQSFEHERTFGRHYFEFSATH